MSSAGTISFTELMTSEKATTNDGFWETNMFKSWKEDTDPLEEKDSNFQEPGKKFWVRAVVSSTKF